MVPGHLAAADLDHRAQLRQPLRLQFAGRRCRKLRQQRVQHLHVVRGLERGRGDDRGAADFGQREFELAQAIGWIDGDENESCFGGGKLRQRPFRPVERPHPDPRAALEAEREKARRQRIDAFGKLFPASSARHGSAKPAPRDRPSARGRVIEAAPDGVARAAARWRCRRRSCWWCRSSCFLRASKLSVLGKSEGTEMHPGATSPIAAGKSQTTHYAAFWPLPASSPA